MTDRPRLIDTRGLMAELGVRRATAETIMRRLPTVRVGRRVYVHRADVETYLEQNTRRPGEVWT
ncbi:MAG: hypothetical protein KJ058_00560 [Thermoanaerobaculia bacterium]|nr:hypothetical protein [Thermoanaerobaculia bacterium]